MSEYTGFGNGGYDYDGSGYQTAFTGHMYAPKIHRRYKNPDYTMVHEATVSSRKKQPKSTLKKRLNTDKKASLATAATLATIGVWSAWTNRAINLDEKEFDEMDKRLYEKDFSAKMKSVKDTPAYKNPRNYTLSEPFTEDSTFEEDLDAVMEEHERSKTRTTTNFTGGKSRMNTVDAMSLGLLLSDFAGDVYDTEKMIKEAKERKRFLDSRPDYYEKDKVGDYDMFYDEKKQQFYIVKKGIRYYDRSTNP